MVRGLTKKLALAAGLSSAFMVGASSVLAQQESVFRVAVHANLSILDPVWTTADITTRYGYAVYDTLYSFDSNFEPQPQMVENYTVSEDGLTYEFTLREGLFWHDGEPVLASDCVASLLRWMPRHTLGQKLSENIETLEVVDDRTFRLVLEDTYGLVLQTLASSNNPAFMMPERIANTDPYTQITEYVGSGPFKFVEAEWQPGNLVVFEKNEDYVPRDEPADYLAGGKIVNFDRLEWRYIADYNTALSALTAGEVDYFEAPPLEYVPLLESNPDIELLQIDYLGVQGLIRPNHLHPPFDNPLARQALLRIVNQQDYMQVVVGNPDYYYSFCGAYFMCGSANETSIGSEPLENPNLDEARALFEEAGYDGAPLVVFLPTDRPQYQAATMVLIQTLREIGVNVEPRTADWSTISSMRAQRDAPSQGGWNIMITAQGGPAPSNPVGNGWFNPGCDLASPGWPCDEELTQLIDDWARATGDAERHEILEAIQLRAFEETVPYVPYGQYFQPIAVRSNVENVLESGLPVYWNITKN